LGAVSADVDDAEELDELLLASVPLAPLEHPATMTANATTGTDLARCSFMEPPSS